MKKATVILYSLLCGSLVFFIKCKKEIPKNIEILNVDSSHISITNASPSILNLQFYLNERLIPLPDTPVAYGRTVYISYIRNATTYYPDTVSLPYININPGFNQLGFGSSPSSSRISILNNNFNPGSSYSLFLMDTIVHGKVSSVLLKDNLGVIDSTKCQIRFLNLSPDAPPIDVWAFPNGGVDGYKIFSHCAYLPNDFNSFIKGQSFSYIDRGPYYFVATIAGTLDILLDGQMLITGGTVITLYVKGYVGTSGSSHLDIGVIKYRQ